MDGRVLHAVRGGAMLLALTLAVPAPAQMAGPLPAEIEDVGINEKPGAQVPLDVELVDENGRTVTLAEYIRGDKPVLLTLVYYRCPMLCGLILNGVVEGLQGVAWTPGKEFEIVTISIDPAETPQLARTKKQSIMTEYGRAGAAAGWHFLTGREAMVRRVADAIGFGYRYVDERKEYAHGAGVFVLTPTGTLARTLYGIEYSPRDIRLGLIEAAEGKVGSTLDRIILTCFHYDANAGSYVLAARRLMSIGGAFTALAMTVWLGTWWRREVRRRRR